MEILNNATLDELREFMLKDEMDDLMRKLLQDLKSSTESIQQLIDEGDWKSLRRVVHRMHGTFGSVGCDRLCLQLNAIELMVDSVPLQIPDPQVFSDLISCLVQTEDELRKVLI